RATPPALPPHRRTLPGSRAARTTPSVPFARPSHSTDTHASPPPPASRRPTTSSARYTSSHPASAQNPLHPHPAAQASSHVPPADPNPDTPDQTCWPHMENQSAPLIGHPSPAATQSSLPPHRAPGAPRSAHAPAHPQPQTSSPQSPSTNPVSLQSS